MDITVEIAREITNQSNDLEKQMKSIEVDIYNAANEGFNSVKTALLHDDIEFFEDIADELEAAGFDDLHFLSISLDGEVSAVLEITW